jgi:RNA polymerase sigma factor (sigma-70 family)
LEASALSHASRRGLLARRSPLLKLERDERLVALIRAGHDRAFEALFDRYHSRLLSFCSSMLKSRQDAEDVLQEVFANAHRAMLADDRKINVRPWLYRIARNRCLNHLRKPVPQGQDSMDVHPHMNGTSTAERVQRREELRLLLADVGTLPETQRSALLLREIEQLTYEEIAVAMETTIPAVKSLLVRARIALAESSEARALSCDEVRVELAEAAEGISKASGPVRKHLRDCETCAGFRDQLRADSKALAAIFPIGPLALVKAGLLAKLFGGSGASQGTGGAAAAIGTGAAGGGAAGGLGALGSAVGAKAVAGVATAALITAGAVEVRRGAEGPTPAVQPAVERALSDPLPATAAKRQPKPQGPAIRHGSATAAAPAAAKRENQEFAEQATASRERQGDEPAAGASATQDAPAASTGQRPAEGAVVEPSDTSPGAGVVVEDGANAGSAGREGSGEPLPPEETNPPTEPPSSSSPAPAPLPAPPAEAELDA